VQPDLSFAASAPLPSLRSRRTAQLFARLGTTTSAAVKLTRRLYLMSVEPAGAGKVRISGRVVAPLASPPKPIDLRAASSCAGVAKGAIVGRVKPTRAGVLKGVLSLPRTLAAAPAVYLRAESKVPKRRGAKATTTVTSLVRGVKTR
jgi:hypothetical protein